MALVEYYLTVLTSFEVALCNTYKYSTLHLTQQTFSISSSGA
jgi:hypothetical protein